MPLSSYSFALCPSKCPFLKRRQVGCHFNAIIFTYLLPYRFYSKIQPQSEILGLEHINFQRTHLSPYHRVRLNLRRMFGVQLRGIPATVVGSGVRHRQASSMIVFIPQEEHIYHQSSTKGAVRTKDS